MPDCKVGSVKNPNTGRCVKKGGRAWKKCCASKNPKQAETKKAGVSKKSETKKAGVSKKSETKKAGCKTGQVKNPNTARCVKEGGVAWKKCCASKKPKPEKKASLSKKPKTSKPKKKVVTKPKRTTASKSKFVESRTLKLEELRQYTQNRKTVDLYNLSHYRTDLPFLILWLMKKHPSDCTTLNRFGEVQLLVWNATKKKLKVPESFKTSLRRCNKRRFVFIYLGINFKNSGHANMLIMDNKKKVVYHFEPHGSSYAGKSAEPSATHGMGSLPGLENALKTEFKKYKVEYISTPQVCPVLRGMQSIQNEWQNEVVEQGTCFVWSFWAADFILSNPDIPPATLFTQALSELNENPKMLTEFILRYAKDVNKFIKQYTNHMYKNEDMFVKWINIHQKLGQDQYKVKDFNRGQIVIARYLTGKKGILVGQVGVRTDPTISWYRRKQTVVKLQDGSIENPSSPATKVEFYDVHNLVRSYIEMKVLTDLYKHF